jgi:Ca2+-binding RTX toxin-like protein
MAYDFRTDTTGDEISLDEARFVELLNDYRTANGVAEVRFSARLSAAGNRHAQDAEAHGYTAHDFSDGSDSGDFYNREFLVDDGYGTYHDGNYWGAWENALSVNGPYLTADLALVRWQSSAPHDAAMLDPVVTEVGIGMTSSKAFLVFGGGVTAAFTGPVSEIGASDAETIEGSSYVDQVTAAGGNDVVSGAAGADILYGNAGADVLYGNLDADTLYGGQDGDTIYGGQSADAVYGNLGADVMYGNLEADVLFGGQGNDTLYGGQGDDTLKGNAGDDLLLGNKGVDRFEFSGGGNDTIQGFDGAGGDRLALNDLGYSVGEDGSGNAVVTFAGGTVTLTGVASNSLEAEYFV